MLDGVQGRFVVFLGRISREEAPAARPRAGLDDRRNHQQMGAVIGAMSSQLNSIMSLQEALTFRRAVRQYDPERPVDPALIRESLQLAQLAPTSSNLQLWEAYHITRPELKAKIAEASFGQQTVATADQLVVFVVREDLAGDHARKVLAFELGNVERYSPEERWAHRKQRQQSYYGRVMPFLHARFLGLAGLLREGMSRLVGLFRPMPRHLLESDVETVAHKSCALVAQTFMLALAERAVDTCPVEGFDEYRVRRLLGLPSGARVSLIVSCGYRTEQGVWGERFRLPFEEVYHTR